MWTSEHETRSSANEKPHPPQSAPELLAPPLSVHPHLAQQTLKQDYIGTPAQSGPTHVVYTSSSLLGKIAALALCVFPAVQLSGLASIKDPPQDMPGSIGSNDKLESIPMRRLCHFDGDIHSRW